MNQISRQTSPEAPPLAVGSAVKIRTPGLNGQWGICEEWLAEEGCWRVQLRHGGSANAKPDDLEATRSSVVSLTSLAAVDHNASLASLQGTFPAGPLQPERQVSDNSATLTSPRASASDGTWTKSASASSAMSALSTGASTGLEARSRSGGSWISRKTRGLLSSRLPSQVERPSYQTFVTCAEMDALMKSLRRQTQASQDEVEAQSRKVKALADEVANIHRDQRQGYLDVGQELKEYVQQSLREIRPDFMSRGSIQTRTDKITEDTTQDLSKLRGLCEGMMSTMRADLTATIREARSDFFLQIERQHHERESMASTLRAEASEHRASAGHDLMQSEARERGLRDALHQQIERQHRVLESRLESVEADLASLREQQAADVASQTETLTSLREATDASTARLLEQNQSLRVAVAEVENIPTRRVEWQVPRVSGLLLACASEGTAAEASFFSPEFEAGGTHGLQLELRLSVPEDGVDACPGECELLLWGTECDLSLVFRLYVGGACVDLQHSFRNLQPCSTGPLFDLSEHVNREEDTLSLGLEILEAVREVELPSRLTPLCDAGVDGTCGFPWRRVEGSVVSHRHLNHRTLDLVQDQVDMIRSRMVRRVEWRVERANELVRCFPQGECLCSAPFDAGGIEGLQFVFYPAGTKDARDGHCSLYVSCPPGTAVHCWLVVGKQRWEAMSSMEASQTGEHVGRSSFCHLDGCIEKDDSITVAMEIRQARQDVAVAQKAHRPAPRQLSSASPGTATEPQGVVSLRRAPAHGALEDVMRLPSIWTQWPAHNADDSDPYHAFNEMRAVKRPAGVAPRRIASGRRCRRPATASSCRAATALDSALGLLPAGPDRYQMYGAA